MSEPKYSDDDLKRVAGIKDEQFQDAFATFFESMDALLDKRLKPIERDVASLKSDMRTVKSAVAETNRDLRTIKRRTDKLEAYAEDTADLMLRVTALEEAHSN